MKICCLVKEVPDAAVTKRIDPETKRLDRSGEKNLNPFDTHAIEAAMQIKEGGVDVDEIVAVTMGPESAVRALHKAVEPYLVEEMQRANAMVPITPLTHGNKNKTDRIVWALQGRFEHGNVTLREGEKTAIVDALSKQLGAKIEAETKVDDSLIGGFVVRVGSRQFDASVKAKLDALRLALKSA